MRVAEDRSIFIAVKDEGIGVAEDNIARVTRPFEQVEASYTFPHEGRHRPGPAYRGEACRAAWRLAGHCQPARRGTAVTVSAARGAAGRKPCPSAGRSNSTWPAADFRTYGLRMNSSRTRSVRSVSVQCSPPRPDLAPRRSFPLPAILKRPIGDELHRPQIAQPRLIHIADDQRGRPATTRHRGAAPACGHGGR